MYQMIKFCEVWHVVLSLIPYLLSLIPYPLSLISYPLSLPLVPYPLVQNLGEGYCDCDCCDCPEQK